MSRLRYHPLKVAEVIAEAGDARSIVFEIPAALADTFRFKPGQHLQLHVPCGARPVPRCYSLSSIEGEPLRVTVKRMFNGPASNWLCDRLKAGDVLDVAAPAGMFTSKTLDGDFLMFAGGSGITPVYSILRTVLARGRGRVRLVYANRDEHSIIFGRELTALAQANPRLEVLHWLDSAKGVPHAPQLAALAHGFEQAQCFICGPGPYMDAAAAALKDLGVPHSQVHVERFVSLPEDADDEAPRAAPAGAPTIEVECELDGVAHRVPAAHGQLLIEALEDAGLAPPYSCRSGACAACMCTLLDGEVELQHNHVLAQSDLDQGWILACQAALQSPVIKVRFPQ